MNPESIASRVAAACDAFKAKWQNGGMPKLAPHLERAPEEMRARLFEALLAVECDIRRARGLPLPWGDYQREWPQYRNEIDRLQRNGNTLDASDPSPGGPSHPTQLPSSEPAPPRGSSASASGHLQTQSFSGSRPDSSARSRPTSTEVSSEPFSSNPTLNGALRYRVVREIARGGMGRVLLAHDSHVARDVAIKELLPGAKKDKNFELGNRFLAEGQVTGQLQHPGVVPVYELGEKPDGQPFYVMKLLGERTLLQAIRDYHDVQPESAARELAFNALMTQFVSICNTLGYAHSQGVIHRDIKPRNVMLGEFGEVLVVDWGLAKVLDEKGHAAGDTSIASDTTTGPVASSGSHSGAGSHVSGSHHSGSRAKIRSTMRDNDTRTQLGRVVGTPAYMSPEQAWGGDLDIRADVFSLGAILYEILTGQPPYLSSSSQDMVEAARDANYVPPRALRADIPPELEAICLHAMTRERDQRYDTAMQIADDVRCWQAGEPVTAYDEPMWRSTARWVRKRPMPFVALASVALAAIVALVAGRWWEEGRRDQIRGSVAQFMQHAHGLRLFGHWQEADVNLVQAATLLEQEPSLASMQEEVQRLLKDTREHQAKEQHGEHLKQVWARIQQLRDDALFHSTLFNGLADEENRRVAEQSARDALRLLDQEFAEISDESGGMPATFAGASLRELRLELLLTLADTQVSLARGKGKQAESEAAQAALQSLDAARAKLPPSRALHLTRARLLREQGDETAAEKAEGEAKAIAPELASDFFLLGDSELQAGRHAVALQHFERTLQIDARHFWARYFSAVSHLQRNQPALALGQLTACLGERPEFAWAYLLRGYAYGQLNDFTASEADFTTAKAKGVEPYAYHINRGVVLLSRNNDVDALTEFEAALKARPEAYQGYVNRAEIHRRRGRPDDALKDLSKAAELSPQVASIPWLRAQIHAERKDAPAALTQLARVAQMPPADSKLRAQQLALEAQLLAQVGKYDTGLAAIDQALALAPERAFHRLRASLLFALGRDPDARQSLDQFLAIENREGAAEALRQRGFERARAGDQVGAVADYSVSLELDPLPAQVHASRGWALLTHATRLALADFEAAVRTDERSADFLNGRAYAQVLLGDHRRAVADAESAVSLGEKSGEPREKIAVLYNAACVYAQALARVTFAADLPDRDALLAKYEERSLALLREAGALVPREARAAVILQWQGDSALEPLRARPGLTSLMQELSTP